MSAEDEAGFQQMCFRDHLASFSSAFSATGESCPRVGNNFVLCALNITAKLPTLCILVTSHLFGTGNRAHRIIYDLNAACNSRIAAGA